MHCNLCIVFYALYSILFILSIVFYALYAMHYILKIVFFELYSMHCILCVVLYALSSMHYNICIAFYTFNSMHCFSSILTIFWGSIANFETCCSQTNAFLLYALYSMCFRQCVFIQCAVFTVYSIFGKWKTTSIFFFKNGSLIQYFQNVQASVNFSHLFEL
jgi:hypothetical protein